MTEPRTGDAGPTVSANLALDEAVARRQAAGEDIVHLGFGEARLPVLPELVDVLARGAGRNAYGPVAGAPDVRAAAAGYFGRRRLPTEADQTVLAPGSKPLLAALVATVPGDVLLPAPAWLTYAPQARLFGRNSIAVPVPDECGGLPDPDALDGSVRRARARGLRPGPMILNSPDNPTGTCPSPELVRDVCAIAREHDLVLVSDEIYRDLIHDPDTPFLSPAEVAPERTVVTSGFSKTLALGGWRIGFARFPGTAWGARLRSDVLGVASEIWSTLAGPMQEVARYALDEPPEVTGRVRASARLHGVLARAVHEIVTDAGALCRPPTAGFYLYPDFAAIGPALAGRGVRGSAGLERHLLDEFGVAALGGHHFGDAPERLRLRLATSMLYGDSDAERERTLHSRDPVAIPHVAERLARLTRAFAALAGPGGTS